MCIRCIIPSQIFTNDGMPRTICDPCRLIIDYCYRFKQICRKSDTLLKQFPLTGCWPERTALPVYPAELQKLVRAPPAATKRKMSISVAAAATNEQAGVKRPRLVGATPTLLNAQKPITTAKAAGPKTTKTIVSQNGSISTIEASAPPVLHNLRVAATKSEVTPRILNNSAKSGAARQSKPPASPTLQATDDGNLELLFDSAEYDENNGDGVTIDAAELVAAENADANDNGEDTNSSAVAEKPESLDPDHCYPCDQCNRTFPLRQLLDMHMERHGRDRVAECDICHKRFFTKYDLTKHALVHRIGEKRFMCAVCPAGFSRANLLVRHELLHQDELRFKCGTCQKKFVSREELDRHERRHKIVRNYQCQLCEKSFAFKQGLERHETIHAKKQPYPCSYCGVGFPTATRLARHLTEHAGTRPYPCRCCNKSFLLSHHLTRHMRSHQKRGDNVAAIKRSAKSGENTGEGAEAVDADSMLECMVCDLAFAGYSELMDHSEQHALESGECPFCKMELVTEAEAIEHMRQHGEQQHACEFCDLMFAQEEHKEQHCQLEHIDEQEMYAIDDRARAANKNATNSDEHDNVVIEVFQSADGEVRQDGEAILHEFIITEPAEAGEQEEAAAESKDEVPEKELEPEPQQPRRMTRLTVGAGRASGSPKILNYAKKEEAAVKKDKSQEKQSNQLVDDDSANIEDMDFEYMDIVKEEVAQPSKQSIAAVKMRMRAKTAADAAAAAHAADAAATAQANASKSPAAATPKASPVKQIPVAQQQLEQQLKNAMRRPDGPAKTPTGKTTTTTAPKGGVSPANTTKPTTSKTSPVLTKVNVKTLPSGVTLKKVQLNRPSVVNAAPSKQANAAGSPQTPVAGAAAKPVLRRVEVPPRKSIIMRHIPAKAATPARSTVAEATPASTGKSTQRIRMTQAQVDAMAREGKIQIKDGQVFVRHQN